MFWQTLKHFIIFKLQKVGVTVNILLKSVAINNVSQNHIDIKSLGKGTFHFYFKLAYEWLSTCYIRMSPIWVGTGWRVRHMQNFKWIYTLNTCFWTDWLFQIVIQLLFLQVVKKQKIIQIYFDLNKFCIFRLYT